MPVNCDVLVEMRSPAHPDVGPGGARRHLIPCLGSQLTGVEAGLRADDPAEFSASRFIYRLPRDFNLDSPSTVPVRRKAPLQSPDGSCFRAYPASSGGGLPNSRCNRRLPARSRAGLIGSHRG